MNLKEIFSAGSVVDSRYVISEIIKVSDRDMHVKALDQFLDQLPVTLKLFHIEEQTTKKELERFRAEVIITRTLSHPCIEAVYDIGKHESNFLYISSQTLKGLPVSKIAKNHKGDKIPFPLILEALYQLLHALDEAHAKGIIHRNINPENILLEIKENQVSSQLTNFGLGKRMEKDLGLSKTSDSASLFTVFHSPEQVLGKQLDERTDIYSLGKVFTQLLHDPDFSKTSIKQISPKDFLSEDSFPDLKSFRTDLPDWFISCLQRMCKKNPNERFSTAKEVKKFILLGLDYKSKLITQTKNRAPSILSPFQKNGKRGTFRNNARGKNRSLNNKKIILASLMSCILLLGIGMARPWSGNDSSKQVLEEKNQAMIQAVSSGNESEVFKLLSENISPELKDEQGTPLLHAAVKQSDSAIVYTLLSHEPSIIHMKDERGRTALEYAILKDNQEMIKLLRQFTK